ASQPAGLVRVEGIDEFTLLLTWTDGACDSAYDLQIVTTRSMSLGRRGDCTGDSIEVDRRLLLQFSVPVDAGSVVVTVAPGS
ncbi:MAG: hypothetical protein ABIR11_02430, partial [Candidatus Limnocylindrales bacterium]